MNSYNSYIQMLDYVNRYLKIKERNEDRSRKSGDSNSEGYRLKRETHLQVGDKDRLIINDSEQTSNRQLSGNSAPQIQRHRHSSESTLDESHDNLKYKSPQSADLNGPNVKKEDLGLYFDRYGNYVLHDQRKGKPNTTEHLRRPKIQNKPENMPPKWNTKDDIERAYLRQRSRSADMHANDTYDGPNVLNSYHSDHDLAYDIGLRDDGDGKLYLSKEDAEKWLEMQGTYGMGTERQRKRRKERYLRQIDRAQVERIHEHNRSVWDRARQQWASRMTQSLQLFVVRHRFEEEQRRRFGRQHVTKHAMNVSEATNKDRSAYGLPNTLFDGKGNDPKDGKQGGLFVERRWKWRQAGRETQIPNQGKHIPVDQSTKILSVDKKPELRNLNEPHKHCKPIGQGLYGGPRERRKRNAELLRKLAPFSMAGNDNNTENYNRKLGTLSKDNIPLKNEQDEEMQSCSSVETGHSLRKERSDEFSTIRRPKKHNRYSKSNSAEPHRTSRKVPNSQPNRRSKNRWSGYDTESDLDEFFAMPYSKPRIRTKDKITSTSSLWSSSRVTTPTKQTHNSRRSKQISKAVQAGLPKVSNNDLSRNMSNTKSHSPQPITSRTTKPVTKPSLKNHLNNGKPHKESLLKAAENPKGYRPGSQINLKHIDDLTILSTKPKKFTQPMPFNFTSVNPKNKDTSVNRKPPNPLIDDDIENGLNGLSDNDSYKYNFRTPHFSESENSFQLKSDSSSLPLGPKEKPKLTYEKPNPEKTPNDVGELTNTNRRRPSQITLSKSITSRRTSIISTDEDVFDKDPFERVRKKYKLIVKK